MMRERCRRQPALSSSVFFLPSTLSAHARRAVQDSQRHATQNVTVGVAATASVHGLSRLMLALLMKEGHFVASPLLLHLLPLEGSCAAVGARSCVFVCAAC